MNEQVTNEVIEQVSEQSKGKGGLLIGAIAAGTALVGYGVYRLVKFLKNKKAKDVKLIETTEETTEEA